MSLERARMEIVDVQGFERLYTAQSNIGLAIFKCALSDINESTVKRRPLCLVNGDGIGKCKRELCPRNAFEFCIPLVPLDRENPSSAELDERDQLIWVCLFRFLIPFKSDHHAATTVRKPTFKIIHQKHNLGADS
jgi:hypothetical protein